MNFLIKNGKRGQVYNIGGGNELENIEITQLILEKLNKSEDLIQFVEDRKGHDLRYSIDCSKLIQLGWKPEYSFSDALENTIKWYQSDEDWWKPIKSGEFRSYYENQYRISYESS